MTTRQFLSILLSCIIFMHPLTALQWLGTGLVFASLYYQAFVKSAAKRKEKRRRRAAPAPAAGGKAAGRSVSRSRREKGRAALREPPRRETY